MQVGNTNNYTAMMQYLQQASTLKQKDAEILPIENPAEIQPIEETPPQESGKIDKDALLQKIDNVKTQLVNL